MDNLELIRLILKKKCPKIQLDDFLINSQVKSLAQAKHRKKSDQNIWKFFQDGEEDEDNDFPIILST